MGIIRSELTKEVKVLLAEILKMNPADVREDANLQSDLGLDSVDFWDAMASFRKRFKVTVMESEIINLKNVRDIIDFLEKKKLNK